MPFLSTVQLSSLLCLLTTSVYAVEIGGYGGGQSGSSESQASAAAMGVISFPIDNIYSIDLRVGHFSTDSEIKTLSKSVIQTTSLEFTPRLRFKSERVTPYFTGGLGVFIMKETLDDQVIQAGRSLGLNIKEELDTAFGGIFGGGLDIELTEGVVLGLDVTYLYYRPKVTATVSNGFISASATDNVNLSALRALVGLKIRFGESPASRPAEDAYAAPAKSVAMRPAVSAPHPSSLEKTREFIIVSYRELKKDLQKGEGPYLTSLHGLLKLKAEEKPEATKKIQALSEVYSNISEFADRVVDLYRLRLEETASPDAQPMPATKPDVPAIPTGPVWEPAPALMDVREFTKFFIGVVPGTQIQLYLTDGQLYAGEFERHQDGLVWLKAPRSIQVFDHKIRAIRRLPPGSQSVPASSVDRPGLM